VEEIGIGEFARRSRLSLKALRLYDEPGVLVHFQPAVESLEAWKQEQGIEDERLTLKPKDLGLRTTYLATGPVTETSVPDDYCDFAVPFA
jgi:hypothetical protein